jgi:hypothetical protein
MDQRHPVYGEADLTVETGEEPAESVTQRVIKALEAHAGVGPLAPAVDDAPPVAKAPAPRRRKKRRAPPGRKR